MNKYIFAVFIFLLKYNCYSIFITEGYGNVIFAKYAYEGRPIWSDQAKNEIIANAQTATKTITVADFINVYPSADEIALTTTTYPNGQNKEDVIRLLTNKSELMFKMFEESGHIENFQSAKLLLGFDINLKQEHCSNISECKSKLEFMRRQYLKLP